MSGRNLRTSVRRRLVPTAAIAVVLATAGAVSAQAQVEVLPIITSPGESISPFGGTLPNPPTPVTVTPGTSNPNPTIGGLVNVLPPIAGPELVSVSGNSRSHIGQTYAFPNRGSAAAWGFLEREAAGQIAALHQVPSTSTTEWARGVMRAWMLIRLTGIINKPVNQRTAQEQGAVNYLQEKIWDRRKAIIDEAVAQHAHWKINPCGYKPPAPFVWRPAFGSCAQLGSVMGASDLQAPSPDDFLNWATTIVTEQSYDRIVRDLAGWQDNIPLDVARPVVETEYRRATTEMRAGLDLLSVFGYGLAGGHADLSGSAFSPFTEDVMGDVKTLFDTFVVSEATSTAMEYLITSTFTELTKATLRFLVAGEIILGIKAIWDRTNVELIQDQLATAQADIHRNPPDLGAMLASGGIGEILGIFMEETLHDHLYERKQGLIEPAFHARQPADLKWERTGRADAAWTSSVRLDDLPLADWRRPLGRSEVLASPRGHWLLLTDPVGGQLIGAEYGKIVVNSPEKSLALGYTGWDGVNWMAWWTGSTFLHIKDRTDVSGQATIIESLERRCPPLRLTTDDNVTGADCVQGTGTQYLSQLHKGDTVLIGDDYRTVARVVDNTHFQVVIPFPRTNSAPQTVQRVAGARSTCWTTGDCFQSEEIHYRSGSQELKARFAGNLPPNLNPTISGRTAAKLVMDPDLHAPKVVTGYAVNTDVAFDAHAVDPDGDAVTVTWTFEPVPAPANGQTASFRWDSEGAYLAKAVATDAHGATATWSRTINVLELITNTAPVPGDDFLTGREETTTEGFVLGNDYDLDNDLDPESFSLINAGTHGDWSKLSGGRIRFVPDQDFSGRASVDYRICDRAAHCADAQIIVDVVGTNDPPTAVDDTASTSRGQRLVISPWLNDTDPEHGLVHGSLARACAPSCATEDADLHGTWTLKFGNLVYLPAAGYSGPASYRYRICDLEGLCDEATIRVQVLDNDAPVAGVDQITTLEDRPITFDVLGNDSDADGHVDRRTLSAFPLTCLPYLGSADLGTCVVGVEGQQKGEFEVSGDGTLTYTPKADYFGPATLRYAICDDEGACTEGQAKITVTPVNDAPRILSKGPDQTVDEGSGPASVSSWTSAAAGPAPTFFSNDGVEFGQAVDFLVEAANPALFSAPPTIDADGALRFTPAPNADGTTTVTFRAHDDGGTANDGVDTSAPQTFTITVRNVNDPPVCAPRSFAAVLDVALQARVTCTDPDGDDLTYELVAGPVTLAGDGTFLYTPVRMDQQYFVFRARDPHGATGTAEATITITAPADAHRPTCTLGTAKTDAQGRLYIEYTVRDTGSGLADIVVTTAVNATMTVPSFAPGTKTALKVRETKILQNKSSLSELRITDRAGNVTTCDPVLAAIAGSSRQRFDGLHQAVSKLSLKNGRPGLRSVIVRVNGRVFRINRMRAGRTYRLNLAKAMRPGAVNRVVVTANGSRRANAILVISD